MAERSGGGLEQPAVTRRSSSLQRMVRRCGSLGAEMWRKSWKGEPAEEKSDDEYADEMLGSREMDAASK